MKYIGLDIGTTTICTIVVDSDTGLVVDSVTESNTAPCIGTLVWEKAQNPALILEIAGRLVAQMQEKYAPIGGIGVTGQMHGIVYLNKEGEAVSNLFTWQDERGNLPHPDGGSFVQVLSERTGYAALATGFGSVTHYYNTKNSLVPADACYFCTIHDYAAMRLAGRKTPAVHPSDAASFGLFLPGEGRFDTAAIERAGMNADLFPTVCEEYFNLGNTDAGVPVFTAIGDNQASFIGSVNSMSDTILVNVGTGSQVSILSDGVAASEVMETRPCVEGQYLLVGSSLCGGRAYALLEKFFREMMTEAGGDLGSMYPTLDRLSEGFEELEDKLDISTQFAGTRQDGTVRGTVNGISVDNFTPRHFAVGVQEGVVNELFDMLNDSQKPAGFAPKILVGSGNGVRKSDVLRRMFSKKFGLPLVVPAHTEEAAYGAALYSMVGSGAYKDISGAQAIIKYV